MTDEEQMAVQRIAEIAKNGWPIFGLTMHPDGIELIERTLGGSRDEITMGFGPNTRNETNKRAAFFEVNMIRQKKV